MLFEVGLFVVSLAFLVKGADLIVDSAARIAKQFGISDFIIGLTIVAVGTSLPELAASVTASFYGDTALAVGNVIGSNVANIGLIVGIVGAITIIKIDKEIHTRDGFFMLLAVILFYIFALDGLISRFEGGFLLLLFFAYIMFFLAVKKKFRQEFKFRQYISEVVGVRRSAAIPELESNLYAGLDYYAYKEILKGIFFELRKVLTTATEEIAEQSRQIKYLIKQLVFLLLGVIIVVVGAQLLVQSVDAFPIPHLVTGMLFVSVGTSLPELAVAFSAIKKKYQNIMVGNLIGSNITNIFLVAGFSAIANPLVITPQVIGIFFPFLIGITWLLLVFSRNDHKLNRIEALTLLVIYTGFFAYLLASSGLI
ncbi:MAG: calcium/sodium antiporter [archaeon]|jgi:cation:H+ antiporter|nr:calcium/sodium antiporter [archaeon]